MSARRPELVLVPASTVDGARVELAALTAEGAELAVRIVALSRAAQRRLARGVSPADLLDEIERLGLRHQVQMTAAAIDAELGPVVHESCVDEHTPGCGRAA